MKDIGAKIDELFIFNKSRNIVLEIYKFNRKNNQTKISKIILNKLH